MSVGAYARVPHATARTPLIQQHAHGAQLVDHSTWGKALTPIAHDYNESKPVKNIKMNKQ